MDAFCRDCEELVPVDVFKGICRHTNELVQVDMQACEAFSPVPKCKYCRHFTPGKEHLGFCMGKTTTYPDLIAKTCEDFAWEPSIHVRGN